MTNFNNILTFEMILTKVLKEYILILFSKQNYSRDGSLKTTETNILCFYFESELAEESVFEVFIRMSFSRDFLKPWEGGRTECSCNSIVKF